MDIKQKITTLLKEAELYRSQGLLNEAKEKYVATAAIIEEHTKIKNRQSLMEGISRKIIALESEMEKLAEAPSFVNVPEKVQDLIKKQFAFASDKNEDAVALEGAISLAKFGQFERALNEFNLLLDKESIRLSAAKNIIRCHISMESLDDAVSDYEKWVSGDKFSPAQLNNLCSFLEDSLEKKGVVKTLTRVKAEEPEEGQDIVIGNDLADEEFLDISAIKITFEKGPQKGKAIEFDVNFQSGNILSLIISSKDKSLIDNLEVGLKLKHVEFFSPIAIFEGTGVIAEKTKIGTGPKRGDYSLDIKIEPSN